MKKSDIDAATEMRLQSWLDTYPNDVANVSREWIEQRNNEQRSDEKKQARINRFLHENNVGWVAKDEHGSVIGVTTPYIDEQGVQQVGSLYVDKKYLGLGVASELMKRVMEYFDTNKLIELSVVSYNERAKAFYRKWGFKEVPDSESLFDDKIPEIKMIRKADA